MLSGSSIGEVPIVKDRTSLSSKADLVEVARWRHKYLTIYITIHVSDRTAYKRNAAFSDSPDRPRNMHSPQIVQNHIH
jgi:hypothetical protein